MMSSTQKSQTNSLRSSLESKQIYDQKSRRSSFVQNLILQYKTQSSRKSSINQSSFKYDQQNLGVKANSKSKVQKYLPTKENLPISSKTHVTVQRKLFPNTFNDQNVNFPLKQTNFLQKYKSTQIKVDDNIYNIVSNRMSRKGSEVKQRKVQKNKNLDCDFQSQYESQILKNIMFCNNVNQKSRDRFVKKGVLRKGDDQYSRDDCKKISSNRTINESVKQIQISINNKKENFKQQRMVEMCRLFDSRFGVGVQLLIQQRVQQGLDLLLVMKKGLKQCVGLFTSLSQLGNKSLKCIFMKQQIQMRQLLCLFMYKLFVSDLMQQKKDKQKKRNQLMKLQQKLQTKYKQLRQKLCVQNQLQQQKGIQNQRLVSIKLMIDNCYLITKMDNISKLLMDSFMVQLNDQGNILSQVKKVIDEVKYITDRLQKRHMLQKGSSKYQGDSEQKGRDNLIIQLLIEMIVLVGQTVQLVNNDNNNHNNNYNDSKKVQQQFSTINTKNKDNQQTKIQQYSYHIIKMIQKLLKYNKKAFSFLMAILNQNENHLQQQQINKIDSSITNQLSEYSYSKQIQILILKTLNKVQFSIFEVVRKSISKSKQFKSFFINLNNGQCYIGQQFRNSLIQYFEIDYQSTNFAKYKPIHPNNINNIFSQFMQYLLSSYQKTIQQIILFKLVIKITNKNLKLQTPTSLFYNTSSQLSLVKLISYELQKQINDLNDLGNIKTTNNNNRSKSFKNSNNIKMEDINQSELYLFLGMWFPRLLVIWYQVLEKVDMLLEFQGQQQHQQQKTYKFKRLTILQYMKQQIKRNNSTKNIQQTILLSKKVIKWIDNKLLSVYYQFAELERCWDIVDLNLDRFVFSKNNKKQITITKYANSLQLLPTTQTGRLNNWCDLQLTNNKQYNIYQLYVINKVASLKYQFQQDQLVKNKQQKKQSNKDYSLQISLLCLNQLLETLKNIISCDINKRSDYLLKLETLKLSRIFLSQFGSDILFKKGEQCIFRCQISKSNYSKDFKEYNNNELIKEYNNNELTREINNNNKLSREINNNELTKDQNNNKLSREINLIEIIILIVHFELQLLRNYVYHNNDKQSVINTVDNKYLKKTTNHCSKENLLKDRKSVVEVMRTFENDDEYQISCDQKSEKNLYINYINNDGDESDLLGNQVNTENQCNVYCSESDINYQYESKQLSVKNGNFAIVIKNLLRQYQKPTEYHLNSIKANIQQLSKLLTNIDNYTSSIAQPHFLTKIFNHIKEEYQVLVNSDCQL